MSDSMGKDLRTCLDCYKSHPSNLQVCAAPCDKPDVKKALSCINCRARQQIPGLQGSLDCGKVCAGVPDGGYSFPSEDFMSENADPPLHVSNSLDHMHQMYARFVHGHH